MRLLLTTTCVLALAASTAAAAGPPDPSDLVLRQGDVPRGYVLDRRESGIRTNEREAREYPKLRARFGSWRRITGYQVEYAKGDVTIGSRADLFRDPSGPREMLAWFADEMRASAQVTAQRTKLSLGDEALLYHLRALDERFTVVVWRFRTVFAVVGAREIGKARTLALARTQQRRIAAALG